MPDTDPTLPLPRVRPPQAAGRDISTVSHAGHVRANNQDSWANDAGLGLMLVADGVGGQGDGRRASQHVTGMIQEFIVRSLRFTDTRTVSQRERIVTRAIKFAHHRLRLENQKDGAAKPSGTTIVGLWIPPDSDMATVFNVGDSSLLRFWAGEAQKMSHDHSLHQLWVEGGKIGTEPSKRVIVQALGISPLVTPYVVSFPILPGTVMVACTDGLTGTLTPEDIGGVLDGCNSAAKAASALVQMVLAGRARDNVTVAVCRL